MGIGCNGMPNNSFRMWGHSGSYARSTVEAGALIGNFWDGIMGDSEMQLTLPSVVVPCTYSYI
jgi:hypothetical protein